MFGGFKRKTEKHMVSLYFFQGSPVFGGFKRKTEKQTHVSLNMFFRVALCSVVSKGTPKNKHMFHLIFCSG